MRLFAAARVVVVLSLFAVGCRTPGGAAGNAALKDAPTTPAAEEDDKETLAFLGEALSRLSATRTFYLTKMPEDPVNARVVPLIVDQVAKTLRLDFSAFATELGSAAVATRLSQVMTFPLPTGEVASQTADLGDTTYAVAFIGVLDEVYRTVAPDSGGFYRDESSYVSLIEQCDEQNYASNSQIASPIPSGADYTVTYDCKRFKRQPGTNLTLTMLESSALGEYGGMFYVPINRLARARRFSFPAEDAQFGAVKRASIEAFFALAALSGLNKIDAASEDGYRGIGDFYRSCEPDPGELPAAATPRAAAERFCKYMTTRTTYSECSFQSSSRKANIGMYFANVLALEGGEDAFGEGEPPYQNGILPTTGKVPVVQHLRGKGGLFIAPFAIAYEEEILFRPSIAWKIEAGSPAIALKPKNPQGDYTQYNKFEIVKCGTPLTDEQAKRISHLRYSLVE